MNLHDVSRLLVERHDEAVEAPTGQAQSESGERRRMLRLGFIVLWAGLILACLLAAIGDALSSVSRNVGSMISNLGEVGAIVMLAGIGLMVYSRFLPKQTPKNEGATTKSLAAPPQSVDMAPKRLPEGIASVTEHTTYRLEAPAEKLRNE